MDCVQNCRHLTICHCESHFKFNFNVCGSVHPKYIPIYIQQDAPLHTLFISGNCSTCFGWYLNPSSGAHTNVSTASGICYTVTATCAIAAGSSNSVINTRCRRYSCMRSWWWMEVPPKTCRAVSRYNKLCNVASCWIYIGIVLRCTDTWTLNL